MFNSILTAFVFLSPILFFPLNVAGISSLQFYQFGFFKPSIDLIQVQIFCYGTILLFITALFDKPRRLFQDKTLAVLFLIYALSVYLHPKTVKIFTFIVFGFLLYYLIVQYVNIKNLKKFFWCIFFVSCLNTTFAVLQFFNVHVLYHHKGEIMGMMCYKTHLGIYQAIALPITFSIHPALSIIPLIGLLLSKSATAIIAAVIGMGFLLRKKLIAVKSPPVWLCFFTLAGLYIWGRSHQLSLRFDAWVLSLREGFNHFWIGNGIGNFYLIIKKNVQDMSTEYTDPYSLYLQVFHAVGIFGIIALFFFLKSHFSDVGDANSGLVAACLVLVIAGFGYSFMDYPRLAGTAIVLFGLLTAVKEDCNA